MCKYRYSVDMSAHNSTTGVLERVRPGSRVLEFGTATGYMSRFMAETLGCTVTGMEIDEGAAALASRWHQRTLVANLDDDQWKQQLGTGTYDHVMFVDVLEHLRDPWGVLQHATTLLAPGGTMLLSIPNAGHNVMLLELLAGDFRYRATGLLDSTHVRFFTWTSILELLQRAGLNPIEATAVTMTPEMTEFGRGYADVPPAVADYLRARMHGHAYQFVLAAQAAVDTTSAPLRPVTIGMIVGEQMSGADALRSIEAMREATGDARFTLTLVENGAGAGSGDPLPEQLGDDVQRIRNPQPVDLAAATAQVLDGSLGEHVVLLEPHTEVQPGWLDALLTLGNEGESMPVLAPGKALSGHRDRLRALEFPGGSLSELFAPQAWNDHAIGAMRVADADVLGLFAPAGAPAPR